MMISYLEYMLKSPLAIWWGAATFAIQILSFVLPSESITFNKVWLVPVIFIVSFCLFVAIIVLYKGWTIYSRTYEGIIVAQIVKIENDQMFLLKGLRNVSIGSVFEVRRNREGVDIPIGFIEVTHLKKDGEVQAKPLWIMPGHLRDIETHELPAQSLAVSQMLSKEIFRRWINETAEMKVKDLIKRGIER